jgi:hypothetical protein
MKRLIIYTVNLLLLLLITAGINSAQEYPTGMLFDDEQYSEIDQKATLTRSLYSNIPKKHSLKKYAPQVKSQGSYGTCVGWASAYAALTIAEAIQSKRNKPEEITAEAFSPGFVYTQIKFASDNNCTLGSHIHDALELMKTKGAAKYNALAEVNCPAYISENVFNQASEHTIEDYAKLFGLFDSNSFKLSSTKKSLSQNNPVIIGMNVPRSFYTAKEVWTPNEPATGKYYGHAMCVVGYDDDLHGGVFEVMNSWGSGWGNSGYIYIRYKDYADFVKYAYEISALPDKDNIIKLAGSIRLQSSEGFEYPVKKIGHGYQTQKDIKAGSAFRIYIKNPEPAYVYAFGFDKTEKVFPIFPHKAKVSPYLSYTTNEVALPDEQHFIQADETLGKNYICILLSKKPIDINNVYKTIENTQGNLQNRINTALGSQLMKTSDITYAQTKASFSAESKQGNTAYIILEANHSK